MRTRLVLVHGSRVSGVQWAAHRTWLEPRYEVVTPVLPGHGPTADREFTRDNVVRVLAEAIESAAPGQPVVLAGHSLGGYAAMVYAARRSERLAGLVTIGAAAIPRGAGAAAYRVLGLVTDRAPRQRISAFNDAVLSRWTPAQVFDPIRAEGYWFDGLRDSWRFVMRYGSPDLLREVTCPVLVVRGQFDQLGVHAGRFAAAAPHGRVLTVRGASHLLPLTRPWQTAAVLDRFARQVVDR